MESKKRTVVKALIYRVYVLLTTYIMFLITGKGLDDALLPTIVINCVWMVSYYVYDRIWANIQWGR